MSENRPSPHELWTQSEGDGTRYRELLREHGHLLGPGDEGYDPDPDLPCGYPSGSVVRVIGPSKSVLRRIEATEGGQS